MGEAYVIPQVWAEGGWTRPYIEQQGPSERVLFELLMKIYQMQLSWRRKSVLSVHFCDFSLIRREVDLKQTAVPGVLGDRKGHTMCG